MCAIQATCRTIVNVAILPWMEELTRAADVTLHQVNQCNKYIIYLLYIKYIIGVHRTTPRRCWTAASFLFFDTMM